MMEEATPSNLEEGMGGKVKKEEGGKKKVKKGKKSGILSFGFLKGKKRRKILFKE